MILVLVGIFLAFSAVVCFCAIKDEFSYLIQHRKYKNLLNAFLFFAFVFPIAPLVIIADSDSSDSVKFLVGAFYAACGWAVIGYLICCEL